MCPSRPLQSITSSHLIFLLHTDSCIDTDFVRCYLDLGDMLSTALCYTIPNVQADPNVTLSSGTNSQSFAPACALVLTSGSTIPASLLLELDRTTPRTMQRRRQNIRMPLLLQVHATAAPVEGPRGGQSNLRLATSMAFTLLFCVVPQSREASTLSLRPAHPDQRDIAC